LERFGNAAAAQQILNTAAQQICKLMTIKMRLNFGALRKQNKKSIERQI
jgi:hypothetical protein